MTDEVNELLLLAQSSFVTPLRNKTIFGEWHHPAQPSFNLGAITALETFSVFLVLNQIRRLTESKSVSKAERCVN